MHLRRRRAADVPGHRHRAREGQEGPDGVHRRRRRGLHRARHLRHVPDGQPALQPDGPAHDVRRAKHGQQPAGRDRDQRRRRRRVPLPVHGQRRWLGEQELPVPGDQGAAQREEPARLPGARTAATRHVGLPALPPRHRHRRHVRRAHDEDGQARQRPLPRHAAAHRRRQRPRVPRHRARGEGARALAADRHRRPVRGQVLLPRRARHPPAAPRGELPGGHRRVLLGRPPGARQDHGPGRVPGAVGDRPRPLPARGHRRTHGWRCRARRSQPADGRDPGRAVEVPGEDPAVAQRADGGGARHRPRQDQGAPRRW